MNQDQIEKINTLLDTEDYDGCFVVTLGVLAKEAKTLAGQLLTGNQLRYSNAAL
jgi:hypothetical protein